MKETFDNLKQIFPDMPADCDEALMKTVWSLQEKPGLTTLRPVRRIAILLAVMLSVTCVASAAFYPQIIALFTRYYGEDFGEQLRHGSVDSPHSRILNDGVAFTVDEVLVCESGLYIMGSIRGEEGYMVVPPDYEVTEPFGYNIHNGETAPDGTPTIAEKAEETGSTLRFANCYLDAVGVDGGEPSMPECWGFNVTAQRDGSVVFSMEVDDETLIRPGKTYTLALYVQTFGANADGTPNRDEKSGQEWHITVTPSLIDQDQIP